MDSPVAERHQEPSPSPVIFLLVPTLGLLLGQGLTPIGEIPASLIFLSAVAGLPLTLYYVLRGQGRWAWAVIFFALAFSVGYWMHYRVLYPSFDQSHLRLIADGKESLYLEGLLYREPERLPDRSRWYLKAERIWRPNGAQETQGNILVTVRSEGTERHYGDRVRLWLRVRPPREPGNPGGFNYESYLARRQIYLTAFLESDTGVELLRKEGNRLWSGIEHLRREIGRFFTRHLPHEQAVLMKALVVGDMGGISQEMRESFAAAGVAHVLSISGLHVGMLGLVAFLLVRFLGSFSTSLLLRWNLLKVAAIFSFLAVVFYTALAGAMVPTVRSAIMIGVYQLAILLDREEEIFSSLALAALWIGLIWPGAILDISFQLSFLAVLFIIWGLRSLRAWWPVRKREELPQERSWFRGKLRPAGLYLAVPLLAAVGTGPMIAYHFGHLSLAGFVSNPVIVPPVGFLIVPVGLLIGFLSLLAPALALPFLWLTEFLLTLTLGLVRFFADLPWASISTLSPTLTEAAILYVALCAALSVRRRAHWYLVSCALLVLLGADGFYWWQQRWSRKELRVTFLNVGHGDAAVVEFPNSKVLVVDAGGSASEEFDTGESVVAPFLRSRKIKKVDYLLVSHPRVDHYGGMKSVVEEFSPSEFWSGPGEGRSVRYRELEEAVRKKGIQRSLLSRRDPCRVIEQVSLCVLYSPEGKAVDSSVVTRLSFGQVSFLFAGDIEKKEEMSLLQSKKGLSSHVLKVPRHGSLSSSTAEFIAAVRPWLAVFSVGHRNPFGLPREEVIARYRAAGVEILRTDEDGAVVVETDGETLRYWTHKSNRKGAFLSEG